VADRRQDITFAAFDTSIGFQTVRRHDSVRRANVDRFFFDVLGVRPLVGGFSPEDFGAATPIRPAIVTAKFWRERFGASTPRVGQVLTSDTGPGSETSSSFDRSRNSRPPPSAPCSGGR
jgi:hypothetical protein